MAEQRKMLEELTSLSEALRKELEARAWPQKRLAALLHRDESTVSLWLSGRQGPRIDDEGTLAELAKFLRSSPTEVRRLLSAQKETSEGGGSKGGEIKVISSIKELERVIAREIPSFDEQVGMLTRTLEVGLGERLLEGGYYAEEDLFRKYLAKRQRKEGIHDRPPEGKDAQAGSGNARIPRTIGFLSARAPGPFRD
ncbi:MAG: helix-turn-helix transcriptional regulator, partial [Acidobacteria bacterium]|nr:helix-turn-helix transcriptional regulator [Acidobacteriota bacterium]